MIHKKSDYLILYLKAHIVFWIISIKDSCGQRSLEIHFAKALYILKTVSKEKKEREKYYKILIQSEFGIIFHNFSYGSIGLPLFKCKTTERKIL